MIDQAENLKAGHPGQSGAPVSGDQAPVWICEGSLSRLKEKHGTAHHAGGRGFESRPLRQFNCCKSTT